MPELPEVETTRLGIMPHVIGRTVVSVLVHEPRLRWPVAPELAQMLTGQTISDLSRRGKYLLFETHAGRLMIHLGMSGSLRVVRSGTELRKHDHLELAIDTGMTLRLHDPRRFGSVFWLPGESGHELIDTLGPEPLTEAFNADYLFELSRRRRVPVKSFIMNSRVVVGVGNIYANEALFMSGIRPSRLAGSIAKTRYERLVENIKAVLSRAITSGGTTLRDFVREDGSPGYFKLELLVYGRAGEACLTCDRKLTESRLGNRSTVYCTRCQR